MEPDISEMIRVSELTDEEQLSLARQATAFLTKFRWCAGVKESFLAFDIGSPIGVFLFRIEPRLIGIDDTLWVIVGHCPPAYIVCQDARDWAEAIQGYIREMQRWVDAIRSGGSVVGLIPVNVSPTIEHAEMLSKRLSFLQDLIDDKLF